LVSRRNVSSEDVAVVCDDELFDARAAATGNSRSLSVGGGVDGIRQQHPGVDSA